MKLNDLPDFREFDLRGKRVILRCSLDVPLTNRQKAKGKREKEIGGGVDPLSPITYHLSHHLSPFVVADETRLENCVPTAKTLLSMGAGVVIIGHLGRPDGKIVADFSLKPVAESLAKLLGESIAFCPTIGEAKNSTAEISMLENLRFWPGEENNDENFAKDLATLGDFFINNDFAASHRVHASIVGLPRLLPSAFGEQFLKEMAVLGPLRGNPVRPAIVVLGGVKADKAEIGKRLLGWADYLLVGGRLMNEDWSGVPQEQLVLGRLTETGKDITMESVSEFKKVIAQAKTIVWAGPVGMYEEEGSMAGTKLIAEAIFESKAFVVIGGGDTEAALTKLGFDKKANFVSSGGGAMLEFLASGTLVGIEVVSCE